MTRIELPYTRATLDNGLTVLVHEHHDVPLVAVNVWYHVGSKNERPGRTGFAHLFEHLMFEGSAHHNQGYFGPLQDAGASLNGSTNADRTNYWETVPREALDLALWLESDRMGHLLPALTDAKLANQRDVVLNERRQNYENRPYGLAGFALSGALYPAAHPYHWPTIGWPADISAASLEDVSAFFSRYYHPANASLAIAGDIGTDEAIDLARAYFGDIPAGPAVARVAPATPVLAASVRLVLEDRVELPRLYLAWHSPELFAQGDAEFDLLAEILGGGKTSRLYRRLVFDDRVATELIASQASREAGSMFQVVATAAPGRHPSDILTIVDAELAALAAHGPTDDEVDRVRAQAESAFVMRLQHLGGFGGRADQLNAYQTYLGDPGAFGRDLDRYLQVTPGSIASAAKTLLARHRVMLTVVPLQQPALALDGSVPAHVI
ncbi:MAG: insulinase family protein [Acidobacteriota bacterium]|nr:insulinase family protein [Acidobacteriota bacterium]